MKIEQLNDESTVLIVEDRECLRVGSFLGLATECRGIGFLSSDSEVSDIKRLEQMFRVAKYDWIKTGRASATIDLDFFTQLLVRAEKQHVLRRCAAELLVLVHAVDETMPIGIRYEN